MRTKLLSVGVIAVLPAALALCSPDYVKGAPEQFLKTRTNQCTYQVGYDRPAGEPVARLVVTIKDVAYGDGKTCWLALTKPNGNPGGFPVPPTTAIGCEATKVLHVPRVCRFTKSGWGTRKPTQYRASNGTAPGGTWKWVP